MEAPLVIKSFTSEPDYLPVKSLKDVKFVLCTETVKIWKIALPMALSALFQFLTKSSSSIYAGHLGDIELSSISIYQSVISSIYFYLMFGMSSALATLCGQAFGAGQIQSTCVYVQRSWIILVATCIFLQAQSKVKVILCISFMNLLIQNGLLYIFIYGFGWGTTGLAMANNITGWGYAVALVVYAIGWCNEGWSGFSMMAFKELWDFAKLCLTSSVMTCLDQWYVTCIMLLIGQLDNPVIVVGSYSSCLHVLGLALDAAPWNRCSHEDDL
ncbi:protein DETOXIFICATION 35-like [Abrus precatorius]|uniref:Protein DETOXIFICATION 35-like n=1 Tax=Abrus precatorius TaxID=3816 RepID=A0A8B8LMV1_ABRPR|nr:protein DETOXIFICATION 35-like [Abrus precatorius]